MSGTSSSSPPSSASGLNNNGRLLDWLETDAGADTPSDNVAHGIVAPIRAKGGPALALNDWMRSIETTRDAAERKRLFYVACTRAREQLHLFATLEENSKGERKPRSGSLLAAAWPAAEPHFTTRQPANLISMPSPGATFAIAATADGPATRTIQRQPLPLPTGEAMVAASTVPATFTRPEGSFAARAFGNALHAFLELLATRLNTTA